jgi:hypothetical protein
MHLKVFVKLKKNPNNPLIRAKNTQKNQQKNKKPKKKQKKTKKPTGLGFF